MLRTVPAGYYEDRRQSWINFIRVAAAALAVVLALPRASAASVWTHVQLPVGGKSIVAMTAGSKYIFGAVRDSSDNDLGIYRTPLDGSGGWEYCGLAGKWIFGITVAGSNDQHMLATMAGTPKIMRASDGGGNWVQSDAGVTEMVVQACAGNGFYPGVVYAPVFDWGAPYTAGIRRSTNFGQTWQLWSLCAGCGTSGFPALDVPKQTGGRALAALYTGFFQSALYISTDAGASWTIGSSHSYDDSYPVDIALASTSNARQMLLGPTKLLIWENNIWQGYYNTPGTANGGHIGVEMPAWDPPNVYLAALEIPDGQTTGSLGVYRSADPRIPASWVAEGSPLETGVPRPGGDWAPYKFVAAPFQRTVAVSVPSRGIWIGHVDGTSDATDVASVQGMSIQGETGASARCLLTLAERADVELALYRADGGRVTSLSNQWLEAGTHTIELAAANRVTRGVYLVRATASMNGVRQQATGKIVIAR